MYTYNFMQLQVAKIRVDSKPLLGLGWPVPQGVSTGMGHEDCLPVQVPNYKVKSRRSARSSVLATEPWLYSVPLILTTWPRQQAAPWFCIWRLSSSQSPQLEGGSPTLRQCLSTSLHRPTSRLVRSHHLTCLCNNSRKTPKATMI